MAFDSSPDKLQTGKTDRNYMSLQCIRLTPSSSVASNEIPQDLLQQLSFLRDWTAFVKEYIKICERYRKEILNLNGANQRELYNSRIASQTHNRPTLTEFKDGEPETVYMKYQCQLEWMKSFQAQFDQINRHVEGVERFLSRVRSPGSALVGKDAGRSVLFVWDAQKITALFNMVSAFKTADIVILAEPVLLKARSTESKAFNLISSGGNCFVANEPPAPGQLTAHTGSFSMEDGGMMWVYCFRSDLFDSLVGLSTTLSNSLRIIE